MRALPNMIIRCYQRQNYDFCLSQGSLATTLMSGGQNYRHLRKDSSECCMLKIIKIG